jgi:hypothetical protein
LQSEGGGKRIKKELVKMGEGRIQVVAMVRISGELNREAVKMALEELAVLEEVPDKVVLGGPTNSLVVHGTGQNRGFHPEKRLW